MVVWVSECRVGVSVDDGRFEQTHLGEAAHLLHIE